MDTYGAEHDLVAVLVCGASLDGESYVGEVLATGLRAPDFLSHDYRRAYRAIQFIHDGGDLPDDVTVRACLAKAGDFHDGWDELAIVRMLAIVPSVYRAEALARAVHRYAEERRERARILSNANTELDAVGEKPPWYEQFEEA